MESYRKGDRNGFQVKWRILLLSILLLCGTAYADTSRLDCSSCHRMPPRDSATGTRELPSGAVKGNHQRHAGGAAASCTKCHGSAVLSYGNNHLDEIIQIQGPFNNWSGSTYSRGGTLPLTSTPPATLGTCATVNCHFESITPPWGTGTFTAPGDCNRCHGVSPSTGSHPSVPGSKHGAYYGTEVSSCFLCHPDHATLGPAAFQHASSAGHRGIAVNFSGTNSGGTYSGDGVGFLPSENKTAFGSCSGIYCHSAGQGANGGALAPADYASVRWGGTVNCGSCHKEMANDAAASGSHLKHAGATQEGYDCSMCHGSSYGNGTVPRAVGSTHANGRIDLSFTGLGSGATYSKYSAGGFAPGKGRYGTCSNASCHANVYGAGSIATAAWGTSVGCSACHSIPMGVNGPATGSHDVHAGAACSVCHGAGATQTSSPTSGHADGNIDVFIGDYPTNVAKHAPDSGYSAAACSTTTCHGRGRMVWGGNTSRADCTKCHGQGVLQENYSSARAWQAAPGYGATGTDVDGQLGTIANGVSNDQHVGAHDAHLRGVNGYTERRGLCTDCHAIPGQPNHANGSTDYSWSNLARNIGTSVSGRGALIPGYTGGTCSNIYCHGGSLNGGSARNPSWTDSGYLAAYVKDANVCGKCHGAPPTSGATLNYNHNGITIATNCTDCHTHEGRGPRHIDGVLQSSGGTCDSCHSYDTVGGSWGSGSHLDGAVAEGWGAHARHIDHLKTLRGVTLDATTDTYGSNAFNSVCGVCHTRLISGHTLNNSSQRFITFSSAYQTGEFPAVYNGVSGTPSSTQPKTCANISCHYNSTPQWQ